MLQTIIIAHMSKVILDQLLPARTLSILLCSDAYLDTYRMSQTLVLNFWLPTSQSLCLGFVVFPSPSLTLFWLSACVAVSITCGYCKCLTAIKAIKVWKLEQDRVSNNSTPAKYLQPWNLVQVEWRTEEKMSQNNGILSRTVRYFFHEMDWGSTLSFLLEPMALGVIHGWIFTAVIKLITYLNNWSCLKLFEGITIASQHPAQGNTQATHRCSTNICWISPCL